METFDIIIIGAGPAGLACAKQAANSGLSTIVFERKSTIGSKVCAGGITWNGLMKHMGSFPTEQDFDHQTISSPRQKAVIKTDHPIIATVDRALLGQKMADNAIDAGAQIRTSHSLVEITEQSVTVKNTVSGEVKIFGFKNLVGADGSSSLVRRNLQVPTEHRGIGFNLHLPIIENEMIWHLDANLFGSGYAWIFPHEKTISIGAYADQKAMPAKELKKNFFSWTKTLGYDLSQGSFKAEYINFDYRGYKFNDNIYLIGDAAGFASGLTGEGIYPAIVSGLAVAREIAGISADHAELNNIIKNNKLHRKILSMSGKSKLIAGLMAEATVLGLRSGIINYKKLEMAGNVNA